MRMDLATERTAPDIQRAGYSWKMLGTGIARNPCRMTGAPAIVHLSFYRANCDTQVTLQWLISNACPAKTYHWHLYNTIRTIQAKR